MMSSSGFKPPASSEQYVDSAAWKPLRLRIRLKHPRDDSKSSEEEIQVHSSGGEVDEEVIINDIEKKEATSMEEESRCWSSTSFKGLPCWSVTGRRGRKRKQYYSTPSPTATGSGGAGGDNNNTTSTTCYDENIMNLDLHPLAAEELESSTSTSDNNDASIMNLDPPRPSNHEAPKVPRSQSISNVGASAGTTEEISLHACKYCSESFSTHQALGGHMTSHRKQKPHVAVAVAVAVAAEQVGDDQSMEGSGESINAQDGHDKDPKPHKCRVCSKAFETGQKLGGHMRKHYTGVKRSRSSHDHGSSSPSTTATSTDQAPAAHDSSSPSTAPPAVKNKASTTAEDTINTKRTPTVDVAATSSSAAGISVTTTKEMLFLPHYFDLNEQPREVGEESFSSSSSSSEETPPHAPASTPLDLTLSLPISLGLSQ